MAYTTLADASPMELMPPISYEEFLIRYRSAAAEWTDGAVEAVHPEYLKGSAGISVSAGNQRIRSFLSLLMRRYAEQYNLGLVMSAGEYNVVGADLRLVEPRVGRRPDILFISEANRIHMQKPELVGPLAVAWGAGQQKVYIPGYFKGIPELVIEFVDGFSRERDRRQKFCEYQSAGIPEYWLIEDEHYLGKEADFFQADTTGVYQNVPFNACGVPHVQNAAFFQLNADGVYQQVPLDADGVYHSRSFPGFWLREEWLWQSPAPAMSAMRKVFGLP